MLVFEERGKLESPEKNLSEQRREPKTNLTHIWRRRGDLNLGHINGRRALSLLRHPLLINNIKLHVQVSICNHINPIYYSVYYDYELNQLDITIKKINIVKQTCQNLAIKTRLSKATCQIKIPAFLLLLSGIILRILQATFFMASASFDILNFMGQKIVTLLSTPFINTTNILLFLSIISNSSHQIP